MSLRFLQDTCVCVCNIYKYVLRKYIQLQFLKNKNFFQDKCEDVVGA